MAEKQLAYRASEKEEFFADDDPLAELARIVGFEPRPAMPAAPAARRQEPAFDLEDELLREFERYDAPRLSPVDDIPLSVEDEPFEGEAAYSRPGNSNDPHFEHHKAEPEFSELHAEQEVQSQPEVHSQAEVQADAYPAAEWSFDDEPATVDWQKPVRHEPESVVPELPRHEAAATAPAAAPEYSEPPKPAAEDFDMADELEASISDVPVAPKPVSAQAAPQWSAATIRLPLANFNTARPQQAAPVEMKAPEEKPAEPALERVELPQSIEPESAAAASFGFPSELDRHELAVEEVAHGEPVQVEVPETEFDDSGFDLAMAARDGDVHSDAALTEPAYKEASASFDLDELLADVSRYPVPERSSAPELPPQPKAAVVVPQPAVVPPAPLPVAPAPVAAASVAPRAEPVATEANDEDPFADHEFQFDLEDIEMELADFDFTEAKAPESVAPAIPVIPTPRTFAPAVAAPAPAVPVAEVKPAPVVLPAAPRPVPAPRPELAARPAEAPILRAPAPVVPVEEALPERPMADLADAEQVLPFDPSEISETDDRIETFEGMHVPTLPPVEKEEPVAVPPEYDFDIDAEMANLFNAPQPETVPEQPKTAVEAAAASWARVTAAKVVEQPKPMDGLDEFERALEEDFRRSVREAAQPPENVTRMTFEASSIVADRRRVRSMRGVAVAAVAVLALGGGAFAAYNWISHGTTILASGEPRIITADKDPVKVVPENPGGKVVPNQDKAVYDRVAGDTASAPKQKALVSSDEQPVDVVQKTLIPDASPDDADGDGDPNISTPVGETEDPRLLPNQGGNAQAAATAPADNQGVPSVSPRKVRTMIVKPDGTLVARDDDAPTAAPVAKAPTSQPKLAPSSSATPINPPAANQLASAATNDAPSAESTPIRVVKTTKLADAGAPAATVAGASNPPVAIQPQPIKPAPVQASAPATTAGIDTKPAAPAASDLAPVPASRPAPAAKPPVAAHPAPAETQVAVASPATQPVKAAPPAAVGAGGYVVQIASLPSEADAKKSQANLSAKFAGVIGGHPIEVKRFDISGKGTYYRVRVVAGTKDQAADLCVRYRAAGGTCLISK